MGLKTIIFIIIVAMLLGVACSEKSTEPENPLDRFIAGVSFGADTLITDMTEPLIVSFITLMNRESVQGAFSCQPEFGFSPHWTIQTFYDPNNPDIIPDRHQFYLFPELPFIPNTTYTCIIDTTAISNAGDRLPIPFEFQFTTSPTMLMSIEAKYDGVDTNNSFPLAIKLAFNTAMDLNALQSPFTTNPGFEYELYGISREKHLFEYRIKSPLMAASHYEVAFSGEIYDVWGNLVNTDTRLNFDTGPVEVIYHFPNPYFNVKSKRPIIQVRFNTMMNKQTTEAAFSFGPGVGASTGTFYWLTDKAVQYYLDADLIRGEEYIIRVTTAATDTYGAPLQQEFYYSFIF